MEKQELNQNEPLNKPKNISEIFHRWEVYDHSPTRMIFMYLLFCADHDKKIRKSPPVELKYGQLIFSRYLLSKETGYTEAQVRTALHHLQVSGEIQIDATNKYSMITILKYNQ